MRQSTAVLAAGVLLGALAGAQAAPAEAPPPARKPTLEEAFAQLAAYQFGQSAEGLSVIAEEARLSFGKPEERKALAARLAGLLRGNTSAEGKRFVCRQLALIGSAAEVSALASLLPDKDLSHMARLALERIPDAAAGEALREALPKVAPALKVGLIASLGARQEAQAVPALAELLGGPDLEVAKAAAAALGKIGAPEAAKVLTDATDKTGQDLKAAVLDAYLECAEHFVAAGRKDEAAAMYQPLFRSAPTKAIRDAALFGLVMSQGEKALPILIDLARGGDAAVIRFAHDIPGADPAKALATALPALPPASQAAALNELAARADPGTRDAVAGALKSDNLNVRLAAIRALATVGDASTVPLLANLAAGAAKEESQEARQALSRMTAKDADAAIVAAIEKAEPKTRGELIRALGARGAKAYAGVILGATRDADGSIRIASLAALEALADEKSIPALIELVAQAKSDAERQAAEKALASTCVQAADREASASSVAAAMATADEKAKAAFLRVLSRIAGPKALEAVRGAVKGADAEVQDAAIRALADWPDASPAGDLLQIAKSSANATHQVLALRGYVRMAGMQGTPAAVKLTMCKEALAVAKRPEERRQALGVLGDVKNLDALKLAATCLEDADCKEEAAAAAVKIAAGLPPNQGQEAKPILEKAIAVSGNKTVKDDAAQVLRKLEQP